MVEKNWLLEADKFDLSQDNARFSSRLGELETTISQLREGAGFIKSDATSMAERHRLLKSKSAQYKERIRVFERKVAYELIVLEGNIAKSLIDSVSLYRVQNLILGCPSKNGISSYVANNVLKMAPSFCNIYIVSKGKINSIRMASHPLKRRSSIPSIQIPQRNSNFDAANSTLVKSSFMQSIDEFQERGEFKKRLKNILKETVLRSQNVFGKGRQILDATLVANKVFEGIEPRGSFITYALHLMESLSRIIDRVVMRGHIKGFNAMVESVGTILVSHLSFSNDILVSHDVVVIQLKYLGQALTWFQKEMEEKMRRLEFQTIQTMEMYHAACKEALREKQKLKELENLRKEDVKKLKEARREKEEALACVEKEKALRMASKEEAKEAQRKAEREVQRRKCSERKARRKSEAKKSALKSLVHSQKAMEYQSLLRILVVLIIFYVYFFDLT
ncbi:U-box domain-containing protein 52-like [Lycium barbarum]|uniref:U-box domain-containing protein 52-like n=1 Tax=Lycium barbarum TaxID=112863 RepID=UPI00293E44C3|nr:U-box domain-containing protein 52-like [Lycium barbarum]